MFSIDELIKKNNVGHIRALWEVVRTLALIPGGLTITEGLCAEKHHDKA